MTGKHSGTLLLGLAIIGLLSCHALAIEPASRLPESEGVSPVSQPSQTAESGKISFTMPAKGWVTIAVDNAEGVRVRNLIADVAKPAGQHTIEWDGRDDNGKLLPPGEYRWVGLTRGALHAVYQGAFQYGTPPWLYGKTGAWTGDHSAATTVVSVGDRILIGSNEAEWGSGLIACNLDGRKLWGERWMNKRPWAGAESLVTVGDRVFANSYLSDTVWEIDPAKGESWLVLEKKDLSAVPLNTESFLPGQTVPALRVVGGREGELYVTDAFGVEPRTYVFDVGKRGDRLKLSRTLPVRPWSLGWLPDGRCVAAMDKTVDVLNTKTGETTPLVREGLSCPWGIAIDAKGRIYVSDQGDAGTKFSPDGKLPWQAVRLRGEPSHQVKIYDSAGRLLRTMGRKGGQPIGKIDPNSFYKPAGLAIDPRGRLWVTEITMCPKRVSVWAIPDDLASAPVLLKQFIGPAMYGGGAAIIDPEKPWRIMDTNFGVLFDVDLQTGKYAPVALPWRYYDVWKGHDWRPDLPFAGKPTTVFKVDGRQYAVCQGGYGHGAEAHWEPYRFGATGPVMIGEYRDDVFVPQAAIGNIRIWMRCRELGCRREEQWLPPVFLEAARRLPKWPEYAAAMKMDPNASDVPHSVHKRGSPVWIAHPWPQEISGFIWTDANGDGRVQADEIVFHEFKDFEDITFDSGLNAYLSIQKRLGGGVYVLPREGFNSTGAPCYRWERLRKISDEAFPIAQVGDDGSMLGLVELRGKDAKIRWKYPSDPRGARDLGRDKEHLLWPGSIHRIQGLRGVVEGPDGLGKIFMIQSTDGMCYLLTRDDGLFIGTVFRPYAFAPPWDTIPEARKGMKLEDYSLQNECFNGSFSRALASGQGFEKDHYYLVGLGRSAVVELTGLETVRRLSGGTVTLVEGVGLYGKPALPPEPAGPLSISTPKTPSSPSPRTPPASLEAPAGGKFARAAYYGEVETYVAWDKRGLHLKWYVTKDATPFVNEGQDWTMLFTTGDSCDFQVESPKYGRCRFVIAMFKDQPIVVCMRYDARDEGKGITYQSDIGKIHVPSVEKLEIPVSVRRFEGSYALQLILPWDALGIEPKTGLEIPVELGILQSDPSGNRTISRQYWYSGASEMVSDVPTEAQPTKSRGKVILR